MEQLIITNKNELSSVEEMIIRRLNGGVEQILDLLDPSVPYLSPEERYMILKKRFEDKLIEDGLSTGHFSFSKTDGKFKVTFNQPLPIIAGFIFEAMIVRLANDSKMKFGTELFKWVTERQRLNTSLFERYQAVGVCFPETSAKFPGYYNPTLRQFDIMFLKMNEKYNIPEPATIINSNIQAGLQVKAIKGNETSAILQPLINKTYKKVITLLRHDSGEHSYEVCLREIRRKANLGEIDYETQLRLENSLGYPEKFGLEQRYIEDYYDYIQAWYQEEATENEMILKGIGIMVEEHKYGSSVVTLINSSY